MLKQLVCVDEQDQPCGTGEKWEVHAQCIRHRAFSVFLWNERGELLIQRRAACKYHSGELWANTCCGHPWSGEDTMQGAIRRTGEELGFLPTSLRFVKRISYTLRVSDTLWENEVTSLFSGCYQGEPLLPDPEEVSCYRWIGLSDLAREIAEDRQRFALWFLLFADTPGLFKELQTFHG